MTDQDFFHLHAHSEFSYLDALSPVEALVDRAVRNGQPGLGLTDHGIMAGATRLYKLTKEAGILAFPGEEFYVVSNVEDKKAPRRHLTMTALNLHGFHGLIGLSSLSHQRENYHYKPRIDNRMLARFAEEYGNDVAVATGCFFGVLARALLEESETVARVLLRTYAMWFPHLFVELQRHEINDADHDDKALSRALYGMAKEVGVPVIITQDAHYEKMSQKADHDFFKSIAYVTSEDWTFPGDSYHLARTHWVKSHYDPSYPAMWNDSLDSCRELLDLNKLEIPALDKYRFRVPKSGYKDPGGELLDRVTKGLRKKALTKSTVHVQRMKDEFEVIEEQGFSAYFLMVHDVVGWAEDEGILVHARGSASGSLICYALGITQVDPLEWGLLFERFLSRDRTKPPDIDLDIEAERRDEVIEFLKRHRDVIQMGTYTRLSVNEWGKGSLLVQFLATKRKELGEDFPRHYGRVKTVNDLPEEIKEQLMSLSEFRPRKSPGAHAAGFVVSGKGQPIAKYLPSMLIPSSGHEVTQMVMEDVEDLGYVKLDLLGQRTLTTVSRTEQMIGYSAFNIALDDTETMLMLRRGFTTGVFQLEGWSATKGCQEVDVRTTMDVIYVLALYRPATIDSGYKDEFLSNRDSLRPGRSRIGKVIEYPHPIFEKHLKVTYGVAVFQEQIMSILRDLGVPVDSLNAFLGALKSSNDKAAQAAETFQQSRDEYVELARAAGMSKKVAKQSWDQISGFAGYGFNKAHGVAYGLLAYRAAYLKCHHPLEFMAALLQTSVGTGKESDYQKEARHLGLKILAADVNVSGVSWVVDPNKSKGIRRGLLTVKGIGRGAAESLVEHQPFSSMEDLIDRVPARQVSGGAQWTKDQTLKGKLEVLRKVGALRSLGVQP